MNTLILLAGGTGSRTGLSQPKQFLEINNKSLLEWCYLSFLKTKEFHFIIVVSPKEYFSFIEKLLLKYELPYKIIESGKERANSVYNGLMACPKDTKLVAIHDSARANIKFNLIKQLIKKSIQNDCGVIPGYLGSDSIKQVDSYQKVVKTLNRGEVFKVQTPQIFPYKKILESYQIGISKNYNGTDCSSYYEQLYDVFIVEGHKDNIKLTFHDDIKKLELLLKK
ncbi:MAG: 2-C-methyl-D-erythritol 4-phosphate cytidylyltransferase [Candidatus Cloacimonadota bacterium]|nr:MAG: 2-C-methyl-D-erythritol 4-phosphate cytidylyltransferase [Candidatus Cloacimonadota bacterium]